MGIGPTMMARLRLEACIGEGVSELGLCQCGRRGEWGRFGRTYQNPRVLLVGMGMAPL